MKKKLKIALLLGGIIGNAYGSNQVMSNENESQTTGTQEASQSSSRSALAIAPANIIQSRNLPFCSSARPSAVLPHAAVEPTLQEKIDEHTLLICTIEAEAQKIRDTLKDSTNANTNHQKRLHQLKKALMLLTLGRQLLMDKLERGDVPFETKNMFSVQSASSGGHKCRDIESLIKEAQQNCLGKVVWIDYKPSAGSKQIVEMSPSPSTKSSQKPAAPRSPIFEGGISWEDIVAEVEQAYANPHYNRTLNSQTKPNAKDF